MRKYKWIMIVICIAMLPLFFLSPVLADVGNSFSGGSGGSGGSFGGGGYGGSGFGLGGFALFGGGPSIIIFIGLAFVFMAIASANKNKGNNGMPVQPRSARVCNEPQAVQSIQSLDPNFSADAFKSYASEVFITLQEAWEAKSWKTVRPLESNTLFNIHNRQIQEYIDRNKTDHMNMQNIREVTIAQFREDGNQEVLVVRLYASLLNYVSDDVSGKIIEGSDTEYVHRTYCLEFIRSKGVKTDATKQLNVTNCPNCGAPTSITSSGECEYCHSIITNGNYGWVLNNYSAW